MKLKPAFEFDLLSCINTSQFSNDNSGLLMYKEKQIEHLRTSHGGDGIGPRNNLENHWQKNFYDRVINWFLFASRLFTDRHIFPVNIKDKFQ